jgi:hypothetical protein
VLRYMDPSTLSTCVEQAEAKGWNGGVMFWEWSDVSGTPGNYGGDAAITARLC